MQGNALKHKGDPIVPKAFLSFPFVLSSVCQAFSLYSSHSFPCVSPWVCRGLCLPKQISCVRCSIFCCFCSSFVFSVPVRRLTSRETTLPSPFFFGREGFSARFRWFPFLAPFFRGCVAPVLRLLSGTKTSSPTFFFFLLLAYFPFRFFLFFIAFPRWFLLPEWLRNSPVQNLHRPRYFFLLAYFHFHFFLFFIAFLGDFHCPNGSGTPEAKTLLIYVKNRFLFWVFTTVIWIYDVFFFFNFET